MTETPNAAAVNTEVTSEEVIGYVSRYLADHGMGAPQITVDTPLADIGLDSISVVELLLSAREDLTNAGRLPADVTLTSMPRLEVVNDLVELIRSLARG